MTIYLNLPTTGGWVLLGSTLVVGSWFGWKVGRHFLKRKMRKLGN